MVFNYIVNVQASNNPFSVLASSASVFEQHLSSIDNGIQRMNNNMSAFGSRSNSIFSGASSSLSGLASQIGATATVMTSLNNVADKQSLENTILFASGANEASKNISFVKQKIEDLKLPFKSSMEGFANLAAGMRGAGLSAETTRNLFTGVAEGATVLGLKGDNVSRALHAISTMASMSTVSAEELKQELSQSLPSAFDIATKAMGMTSSELMKAMEKGEVMSATFLPKFAQELHNTFGGAVSQSLQGARANFNVFSNSLYNLSIVFGENIMPVATSFLNSFLIPSITFVGEHITLFTNLGYAMGGYWAMTKGAAIWTGIFSTYQGIATGITTFHSTALYFGGGAYGFYTAAKILATEATFAFTTSLEAMNLAFLASPVFWIGAAVVGVGAAVYWAWNKFEGFRGVVLGVGYALKEFGSVIYDWVLKPLFGVGEVIAGVLMGDLNMIEKGLKDTASALSNASFSYADAGYRVGSAFMKGYNDGVGNAVTGSQSVMETDALGKYYSQKDGDNKPVLGGAGGTSKKTKDKIDGINGGGRKVTNISIDFKNLVEVVNINSQNVTEGAKDMQEIVFRSLMQLLNNANQIQLQ